MTIIAPPAAVDPDAATTLVLPYLSLPSQQSVSDSDLLGQQTPITTPSPNVTDDAIDPADQIITPSSAATPTDTWTHFTRTSAWAAYAADGTIAVLNTSRVAFWNPTIPYQYFRTAFNLLRGNVRSSRCVLAPGKVITAMKHCFTMMLHAAAHGSTLTPSAAVSRDPAHVASLKNKLCHTLQGVDLINHCLKLGTMIEYQAQIIAARVAIPTTNPTKMHLNYALRVCKDARKGHKMTEAAYYRAVNFMQTQDALRVTTFPVPPKSRVTPRRPVHSGHHGIPNPPRSRGKRAERFSEMKDQVSGSAVATPATTVAPSKKRSTSQLLDNPSAPVKPTKRRRLDVPSQGAITQSAPMNSQEANRAASAPNATIRPTANGYGNDYDVDYSEDSDDMAIIANNGVIANPSTLLQSPRAAQQSPHASSAAPVRGFSSADPTADTASSAHIAEHRSAGAHQPAQLSGDYRALSWPAHRRRHAPALL